MNLIQFALGLSTLLCSVVAGFVFAFAVVVMPGIQNLNDHDFLRAFKAMDRVIQNGQPIFLLVWVGSAVMLLLTSLLTSEGIRQVVFKFCSRDFSRGFCRLGFRERVRRWGSFVS